jgi:peptidoglycan hydrolase-like protein with peptidoglycan-binding domain
MTPAITAYAASMGLLQGGKPNVDAIKKFQTANGLQPDGMIGPNTAGAILSAQKPGMAGSGRGGQGGPTAAQLAGAQKPAPTGGQAASPAAPAADAPAPSLINRFRASRGLPTSEEVSAPTRQESIRSEDDEILARIKSAFRF